MIYDLDDATKQLKYTIDYKDIFVVRFKTHCIVKINDDIHKNISIMKIDPERWRIVFANGEPEQQYSIPLEQTDVIFIEFKDNTLECII